VRNTLRCLVILGLVAQGLLAYAYRQELAWMLRGQGGPPSPVALLMFLSPAILGLGGAAAAGALCRRGSGWAWLAALVPLAFLAVGCGGALYFTLFPPPMHGGNQGLPL